MLVETHPAFDDHDEVSFFTDRASGLKAIVARHRVWDRPSIGGCRMRDYDTQAQALADALRLSRGMTYKSVMAGLDYGGAKAVIIGVPTAERRASLFRAMGRRVAWFGGGFRTGMDLGLKPEDLANMEVETDFTLGTVGMAPAEVTALGVRVAIQAALARRLGNGTLRGRRVAVQGLGNVGYRLAELLIDEGASVLASDVKPQTVEKARRDLGLEIAVPEAIHAQDADVFCPCALGGGLTEHSVAELRAVVVAGSANNQLHDDRAGQALTDRGILYAPDYIANAGGLIAVAAELENEAESWIWQKLQDLVPRLNQVFAQAEIKALSTAAVADLWCREQIVARGKRARAPEAQAPSAERKSLLPVQGLYPHDAEVEKRNAFMAKVSI